MGEQAMIISSDTWWKNRQQEPLSQLLGVFAPDDAASIQAVFKTVAGRRVSFQPGALGQYAYELSYPYLNDKGDVDHKMMTSQRRDEYRHVTDAQDMFEQYIMQPSANTGLATKLSDNADRAPALARYYIKFIQHNGPRNS